MENKLFNDDCFNMLEKMDQDSVDMVLVDLPYRQTDCD
jgi:DNA modification methylase